MVYITQFLGYIWDFMSGINVPFLGISFASLFLTVMVIDLSISILKIFLGVGRGGFRGFGSKHQQDRDNQRRNNSKYDL